MLVLVLLLVCAGSALTASTSQKVFYNLDDSEVLFERFIQDYGKTYANEVEKMKRFEIFKENLIAANEKNKKYPNTIFGITKFMDLTKEEFKSTYGGARFNYLDEYACPRYGYSSFRQMLQSDRRSGKNEGLPESLDWRDSNVVTRVKNQGGCGSCWAFSIIGNAEGQYALKHNTLVELSEQQLLDCDYSNNACWGGWTTNAGVYLMENGAMTEADYPYAWEQQNCKYNSSNVRVKVNNCKLFLNFNEEELKELLFNIGPLSMGIVTEVFGDYVSGVLQDCPAGVHDHAVLLVGYGTENGIPYWLIKNSWSSDYGENGYAKIERGVNACGITASAMVTVEVD